MESGKSAQTALALLRNAMVDDDQDAADFLVATIERDQLYRHYTTDAGEPITCMGSFVAELNSEVETHGTAPVASATGDNRPLCEMTVQERYKARMAAQGR